MSEYFVSCARMKTLEQNTDAAGLSYYQMMENAGTLAANRIVEITMATPISDTRCGAQCGGDNGASAADSGLSAANNGVSAADTSLPAANISCASEAGGQPLTDNDLSATNNSRASAAGDQLAAAAAQTGARLYPWALDRHLRVRVYCGKGNNGGDGFVVARRLKQQGWDVDLVLVDGEPVTPDAIENRRLTQQLAIPEKSLTETEQDSPDGPDVVVDAIYGTGFHGQLREAGALAAAQIAAARARGARVFALDIPSGMGGDLTEEDDLDPRCVRADVTITFHAKKAVHLQGFAGKYCGRIIVADIGIVDADRDAADQMKDPEQSGVTEATRSFEDFVEIIRRLRAPDGCPWDRAQTHETLKKYLLEETQEAADAIDNHDDANFCEELGDVLLQVVLNAQVAKERGAFTIEDVIEGISGKMIRRHPWVFGDMKVSSPEEGEKLWEEIKKKEKEKKNSQGS